MYVHETRLLTPADAGIASSAHFAPSNPTGTTSTSKVMMGLGSTITFTPSNTGIVKVTMALTTTNNTINDGVVVQLAYGTGTAPANGATATGTAVGSTFSVTFPAASVPEANNLIALITGLTSGTAYWIDIQMAAVTGGTATATNIYCIIEQLIA